MQDITVRIRRRLLSGLICKIWSMIMIYELATIEELQAVYDLVQHTIKSISEILSGRSGGIFL